MSGALQTWYSAAAIDAFAARSAVLGERIELSRFERLAAVLANEAGCVEAELRFAPRRTGWIPVDLCFRARLELTCQRCLEAYELDLNERVEIGFVESASLEAELPEGCVAVVLEDDRLRPAMLLEDELLVSLPLVPRHETTAQCGALGRDDVAAYLADSASPQGSTPQTNH